MFSSQWLLTATHIAYVECHGVRSGGVKSTFLVPKFIWPTGKYLHQNGVTEVTYNVKHGNLKLMLVSRRNINLAKSPTQLCATIFTFHMRKHKHGTHSVCAKLKLITRGDLHRYASLTWFATKFACTILRHIFTLR